MPVPDHLVDKAVIKENSVEMLNQHRTTDEKRNCLLESRQKHLQYVEQDN